MINLTSFKEKVLDYGPKRRTLRGSLAGLASVVSVLWITFHVVLSSGIVHMFPMQVKIFHLCFALILCFLFTPPLKQMADRPPLLLDYVLILFAVASLGYLFFRYESLVRMAGRYSPIDIVMGVIALLVLLEAARRAISPGLFILAVFTLVYAFYGRSFPMPFKHVGFNISALTRHLMLTGEGVFGFVLGVSAEIIIVFIVFGAVLQEVKIADFFYDLSRSVAGKAVGGPAKVAVIFSSLMGMVSGETSANVATTGAFTIPLMKRMGYKPYFAGAVETAASAGGQIMPPIMGATAFVIADALGVPYLRVVTAAIIPAILYYVGVFATVHFRAVKLGLHEDSNEVMPRLVPVMKKRGFMLLPIIGIIGMLILNYTPTVSAFWGGIVLSILLTSFHKNTRLNTGKIVRLMERSAKTAMSLAIAMAVVGILVGVASITGITMTISDKIFQITGGSMTMGLILTMIVAIILGMGVPTTPAYVLASISAAPVLLRMGLPDIVAHMFVFYFAVMSALTPPVCTGAYTAAGLAGANPNKVGFTSLRLALGGFIVPFLFVFYNGILLVEGFSVVNLVEIIISSIAGLIAIAAAYEGYFFNKLSIILRIFMGISVILLLTPGIFTDLVGWTILLSVLFFNRRAVPDQDSDTSVPIEEKI